MRANIQGLLILGLIAMLANACSWDVNGYRHAGGRETGTYRCIGACP